MTIQRGIVGCNSIKIINPSAKANSLYGNSLSARNLSENLVWLSSGNRRANSRLIIALCFEIIEIEKMRTASRTARLYLDLLTIARTQLFDVDLLSRGFPRLEVPVGICPCEGRKARGVIP